MDDIGPFSTKVVKTAIMVRTTANFLSVIPTKNSIALGFQLAYEINEFPLAKSLRMSKNRRAHKMFIDSAEDIDKQLIE